MTTHGIGVLCIKCGLVSRRPIGFLRARRSFVCGGCKEIIPLDERSVLDREGVCGARHVVGAARPDQAR
ncbi:MAG: hypothetical protein ACREFL_18160 [Stellaceae bacterium]